MSAMASWPNQGEIECSTTRCVGVLFPEMSH